MSNSGLAICEQSEFGGPCVRLTDPKAANTDAVMLGAEITSATLRGLLGKVQRELVDCRRAPRRAAASSRASTQAAANSRLCKLKYTPEVPTTARSTSAVDDRSQVIRADLGERGRNESLPAVCSFVAASFTLGRLYSAPWLPAA